MSVSNWSLESDREDLFKLMQSSGFFQLSMSNQMTQ